MSNASANIANATIVALQNGMPVDVDQRGKFIGLNFLSNMVVSAGANGFLDVDGAPAVSPGGSDGQLQYNNGGVFGGTTGIAYNDGLQILESQRIFRFGAGATFAVNPWISFPGNVTSDMIGWRNILGTGDHIALANDGGDLLYVGSMANDTNRAQQVRINPTSALVGMIAGNILTTLTAGQMQYANGIPLIFGVTAPALTGTLRGRNLFEACLRNAGDTADCLWALLDASNNLYIGDNAGNTKSTNRTYLKANNVVLMGVQGFDVFFVDSTEEMHRLPIVGMDTANSPYGAHAGFTYAFALDANYTVTAGQYKYDHAQFDTGAISAGRTVTWPHPAADIKGYYKTIFNNTNQTLTISTGTGTTRTLATTLAQRFYFDSSGVRFAGATYTP